MEIRISTTREAGNACVHWVSFFILLLLLLLLLHACPLYSMFFSVFLLLWFFFFARRLPPRSVPRYNVIRVFVPHLTFVRQTGTGIKTSSRSWTRAVRLSRFTRFRLARYTGLSLLCNIYILYVIICISI